METPSLDDVALFLAVSDAGSLSAAARTTAASLATLNRRMTALERALDRRLFERGARGYALTAAGRAFLAEAEPLREAATRIHRHASKTTAHRVRITAGLWTSRFLARSIASVWSPDDSWVPEFVASNADMDIARRAADIGIRNREPTQSWLAGRKTRRIQFGVYASHPDVQGYVSLSDGVPSTPSDRWLRQAHGDEIITTVSDARLALDVAQAGIARVVLPTFAGDGEAGLIRIGPPIADIGHFEWVVSHHDGRHDPPVRAALDAVTVLLLGGKADVA